MNEIDQLQKPTPRILFLWTYLLLSVCGYAWISGSVNTSTQMGETCSLTFLGSWCSVYDVSTNALFMWRQLPFIPSQLSLETIRSISLIYHALILFIGITLFHRRSETQSSYLERGLLASITCFLCTFLFRDNPLIFGIISGVPLLSYVLIRVQEKVTAQTLSLAGVCSLLVTMSANQVSFVVLLLSFLLSTGTSPTYNRAKIFTVAVLPVLLIMFIAPIPSIPSYPQGSLVVPDDNLIGMIRPYIGTTPPIPIINHSAIVALYSKASFLLLIPTAMLLISARMLRLSPFQYFIPISLSLACIFDTCLGESIASISPLASLARIIPGYFFLPLTPIALALCIISLLLLSLTLERASLSRGILLVLGIICIGSKNSTLVDSANTSTAKPQTISDTEFQQLQRSPSYPVIVNEGPWIIDRRALIQSAIFQQPTSKDVLIRASHEQDSVNQMIDSSNDTRWTRGHATQEGNEWLLLQFNEEKNIDGIELSTGPYITDFPRGITISLIQECPTDITTIPSSNIPQSLQLKSIIERPLWRGAIEYTPEGFPYYRGTYDVKVYFPETVAGRCFLIQQTGATRESDWSVARLKILEAP